MKTFHFLGESSVEKFVKSCLKSVLTIEAACSFTWCGQHNNIAVENFRTMNAVKSKISLKI